MLFKGLMSFNSLGFLPRVVGRQRRSTPVSVSHIPLFHGQNTRRGRDVKGRKKDCNSKGAMGVVLLQASK